MTAEIESLLHPRVRDYALPLYLDGHYPSAALEAMKQVEIALRETGIAPAKLCGENLVRWILGQGGHITLSVPFGDDLQDDARLLFRGAFRYYRNYSAHDGAKIDDRISLRILVVASELLDLIGASSRSYSQTGGANGLIREGIFKSDAQLREFLSFLDGQQFPHEAYDGFFEEMHERGYHDLQYESAFDLGLVAYESKEVNHSPPQEPPDLDRFGWFELTTQGRRVLSGFDSQSSESDNSCEEGYT